MLTSVVRNDDSTPQPKPERLLSYLPWTIQHGHYDMRKLLQRFKDVDDHALQETSGYTSKGDYADASFDLANDYQNGDYRYYLELYADAVLTIKEQVRPTKKAPRGAKNSGLL